MRSPSRASPSLAALMPSLARLGAMLCAALVALGDARASGADDAPMGEWERISPATSVLGLYAPTTGPLFVYTGRDAFYRAEDAFYRSDDAGDTWTQLPLPHGAYLVAMDPTDHAVVYFTGQAGLYRSDDGGATLGPPILATGDQIERVAISPADRDLLYVALRPRGSGSPLRLLRSGDRGGAWEVVDEVTPEAGCSAFPQVLSPHPTDRNRLFYQSGQATCVPGEDRIAAPLRHSTDQGASWSSALSFPAWEAPVELVGGSGAAPSRFYLVATYANTLMGSNEPIRSPVYRTDDDGQTWTSVGAIERAFARDVDDDSIDPDRLYASLGTLSRVSNEESTLVTSADGGRTWTHLGRPVPGRAGNLVLGIDQRNVYAVIEDRDARNRDRRGLWRLRLP